MEVRTEERPRSTRVHSRKIHTWYRTVLSSPSKSEVTSAAGEMPYVTKLLRSMKEVSTAKGPAVSTDVLSRIFRTSRQLSEFSGRAAEKRQRVYGRA